RPASRRHVSRLAAIRSRASRRNIATWSASSICGARCLCRQTSCAHEWRMSGVSGALFRKRGSDEGGKHEQRKEDCRHHRRLAGHVGAALVEAYRDRGYGVIATARSIRPTNDDQILVVPGDIADRKTAERAISEGLARFGRIDTLINNAGVFVAKPFTQY